MKIQNPTDNNILNYRIETPKLVDENGVVLVQGKTETNISQSWEDQSPPVEGIYSKSGWDSSKTKRSKVFSIKAHETKDLPVYAVEVLLKTYEFLKKL